MSARHSLRPSLPPVSWTPLSRRRQLLANFDRELPAQEFHILGAGITGLVAAVELLRFRNPDGSAKHRVTLYEGSPEAGGRIRTHRAGQPPEPGQPDTRPYVELGAMRIPESHDYTWTYAREAGLQRRQFLNADRTFEFEGQLYRMPRDLEKLVDAYGLEGRERQTVLAPGGGPGRLFDQVIMKPEATALDREYGSPFTWRRLLVRGVIEGPGLQRIDGVSLSQVLAEAVERGELSQGGRRLIVDLLDLGDLQTRAFLMFLLTESLNFGRHLWELCRPLPGGPVLGGMDQLVHGLVARLPEGVIRTGREVEAISTDEKGEWKVRFKDGSTVAREGRRHRHLLCTIPFSKLTFEPAEVELEGFADDKLDAMRGLGGYNATKVGLYCRRRFWPLPTGGGRALSDRESRATYFPNDGHRPQRIPLLPGAGTRDTEDSELGEAPGEVFSLYTQPLALGAELKAEPDANLPSDWVLLSSYTYGQAADRMAERGSAAAKLTQQDLKSVFPDIEKETVPGDPRRSPAWSWRDAYWARGAFALPAPGTVGRHLLKARAPHRGIFFAGDGLSPAPGWIQGAAYSALYALEHIQRTLLGRGEPDAASEGDEGEPGTGSPASEPAPADRVKIAV